MESGPTFFAETCTIDETTWFFDCTPTGGGAIDITWSGNRAWSQFSNGVNERRWGNYVSRWSGQYRDSSADATGSLLGHTVDGGGAIRSGRGVQIDIMPADPFLPPPR